MNDNAILSESSNPLIANEGNKKWYIIQVYSGSENTVVNEIKQRLEEAGLTDLVQELIIPVKDVVQLKRGKRVTVKKNFLPGYVLVLADLTEEISSLIRSIPRVSGFLGTKRIDGIPKAVSVDEVNNILQNIHDSLDSSTYTDSYLSVGEVVTIIDGPFVTFSGTVEEVDNEKRKAKLSVSIFDRLVPVELNFDQVEKHKDS